jgi:2-oxoisovalerate dehydrogenase E1 component
MGEGIRTAKVVALLKEAGRPDRARRRARANVETDKAVYPIESSFVGTMGEWNTKVDETVEIGQELGPSSSKAPIWKINWKRRGGSPRETAAPAPTPVRKLRLRASRPCPPRSRRKLGRVVPANLQIDARWEAIRETREAAKKGDGDRRAFTLGHDRVGRR